MRTNVTDARTDDGARLVGRGRAGGAYNGIPLSRIVNGCNVAPGCPGHGSASPLEDEVPNHMPLHGTGWGAGVSWRVESIPAGLTWYDENDQRVGFSWREPEWSRMERDRGRQRSRAPKLREPMIVADAHERARPKVKALPKVDYDTEPITHAAQFADAVADASYADRARRAFARRHHEARLRGANAYGFAS